MTGTWVFYLLNGGLVAGPSPGSIFAYGINAKGSFLATIAGVTAGTIVTFVITSLILKMERTSKQKVKMASLNQPEPSRQ